MLYQLTASFLLAKLLLPYFCSYAEDAFCAKDAEKSGIKKMISSTRAWKGMRKQAMSRSSLKSPQIIIIDPEWLDPPLHSLMSPFFFLSPISVLFCFLRRLQHTIVH
jgi:hypothetical protein